MRASRVILVCACAAIGVVVAILWIASPRAMQVTLAAPQFVEGVDGSHRESAVLTSEPKTPTSSMREVPPAPGIHGRLIEAATGAPLAGWKIRLQHSAELPHVVSIQFDTNWFQGSVPETVTLEGGDVPIGREGVTMESADLRIRRNTAGVVTIGPLLSVQADSESKAADVQSAAPRVQLFLPTFHVIQNPADSPPSDAEPAVAPDIVSDSIFAPESEGTNAEGGTIGGLLDASDPTPPSAEKETQALALTRLIGTQVNFGAEIDAEARAQAESIMHARLAAAFVASQGPTLRWRPQTFPSPADSDETSSNCTQAECVTDADGRFDLPCPESDGAWLQLEPQPPLYPDSRRYPLHRIVDACARPIEWKTRLIERANAHLLVLDAATGEPVPFLSVVLSDATQKESCTTDAEGRCTTTKPFATGRVRAAFEDGQTQPRAFDSDEQETRRPVRCDQDSAVLAETGGDLVFRVAIGPTFRIAWHDGPEPGVAFARIHGIVAQDHADQDEFGAHWSLLRTESGWFVRLPVPVKSLPHGTPTLDLWTNEMQLAHLELTKLTGRSDLIEVTTHLGAQAHGRVLFDEDHLIFGGRVSLIDSDGNELDSTTSGAEGVWHLSGIDPAKVSWVQVDFEGLSKRTSVPFRAGENREIDLTLEAPPH